MVEDRVKWRVMEIDTRRQAEAIESRQRAGEIQAPMAKRMLAMADVMGNDDPVVQDYLASLERRWLDKLPKQTELGTSAEIKVDGIGLSELAALRRALRRKECDSDEEEDPLGDAIRQYQSNCEYESSLPEISEQAWSLDNWPSYSLYPSNAIQRPTPHGTSLAGAHMPAEGTGPSPSYAHKEDLLTDFLSLPLYPPPRRTTGARTQAEPRARQGPDLAHRSTVHPRPGYNHPTTTRRSG